MCPHHDSVILYWFCMSLEDQIPSKSSRKTGRLESLFPEVKAELTRLLVQYSSGRGGIMPSPPASNRFLQLGSDSASHTVMSGD